MAAAGATTDRVGFGTCSRVRATRPSSNPFAHERYLGAMGPYIDYVEDGMGDLDDIGNGNHPRDTRRKSRLVFVGGRALMRTPEAKTKRQAGRGGAVVNVTSASINGYAVWSLRQRIQLIYDPQSTTRCLLLRLRRPVIVFDKGWALVHAPSLYTSSRWPKLPNRASSQSSNVVRWPS